MVLGSRRSADQGSLYKYDELAILLPKEGDKPWKNSTTEFGKSSVSAFSSTSFFVSWLDTLQNDIQNRL